MTIIKINGQNPEDALAEAQMKVRLAEAQVAAAQRRIRDINPDSPDSDHHIALMSAQLRLHCAQQELKRVSELMGKTQFGDPITIGAGGDGGVRNINVKVDSIDDSIRSMRTVMDQSQLSFTKKSKVASELIRLTSAVREAGKEYDRLQEEQKVARDAAAAAQDATFEAGTRLNEARTALMKHLGGGEVRP